MKQTKCVNLCRFFNIRACSVKYVSLFQKENWDIFINYSIAACLIRQESYLPLQKF